jgi:hypothetical protein
MTKFIKFHKINFFKEVNYNKECDKSDFPQNLPLNNIEMKARLLSQKRIKDYKTLGLACRRAGKSVDEGRSYFSIGVLYDNIGIYMFG